MKYLVCILALAAFVAADEPKKVDKRGVLSGLGYSGLGYSGLGGLGYGGLGYSGLGYGYGAPLVSHGLPLAYSKTIAAPIAHPIAAPAIAAPLHAPIAHAAIAAPALHAPLAYSGLGYGYGLGHGLGHYGYGGLGYHGLL